MNKVDNRILATSIREQAKRHAIYSRERKKESKARKFVLKNMKFLPCV
jgi:uncharacterized membrane protein